MLKVFLVSSYYKRPFQLNTVCRVSFFQLQLAFHGNLTPGAPLSTRGVNSKKGCFRRNAISFRESEDFAGIRELGKSSGKYEVTKLKFWECVPKIRDDIPNCREDFCSRMVLLKKHLLELSPLVL